MTKINNNRDKIIQRAEEVIFILKTLQLELKKLIINRTDAGISNFENSKSQLKLNKKIIRSIILYD